MQNLIAFFVALELLSVPLYVLCGSATRREQSLESGLKYLIIGSLGSATLLYGLAFIYGASGSTDFDGVRAAVGGAVVDDPLLLIDRARGRGARVQALGRPLPPVDARTSIRAPRPRGDGVHGGGDEGGGVLRRGARRRPRSRDGRLAAAPLAALGAVSIVVGNAGALGQDSLKRLLGYLRRRPGPTT